MISVVVSVEIVVILSIHFGLKLVNVLLSQYDSLYEHNGDLK